MAKKQHTGLSGIACNASDADRTIELLRDTLDDLVTSVGFGVSFTPNAAGDTVVTVRVYKSGDNGDTWHIVPAWSDRGGGLFVGEDFYQQVTLSAAGSFWVDVDLKSANALKAVFSTDTEDADDEISVSVCSEYGRW